MIDFAVTWDYRCPFARNAHEHLVVGLRGGAPWQVRFVPFSLGQVHVAEGEPDIWNRPEDDSGLLALQAGVVVRDRFPDQFLDAHLALFAARHDQGLRIKDPAVVRDALSGAGLDADEVLAEVTSGAALKAVQREHEEVVASHEVWGVPTFMLGELAVFVRLMNRPEGDADLARRSIEQVVDLLGGWPELNEFKHTTRSR